MVPWETISIVFPRVLMFVEGNIRTRGKTKLTSFARDQTDCVIYLDFSCNGAGNNCGIVSRSGYIWIWSGQRDQGSTNHSARFVERKSRYIRTLVIWRKTIVLHVLHVRHAFEHIFLRCSVQQRRKINKLEVLTTPWAYKYKPFILCSTLKPLVPITFRILCPHCTTWTRCKVKFWADWQHERKSSSKSRNRICVDGRIIKFWNTLT